AEQARVGIAECFVDPREAGEVRVENLSHLRVAVCSGRRVIARTSVTRASALHAWRAPAPAVPVAPKTTTTKPWGVAPDMQGTRGSEKVVSHASGAGWSVARRLVLWTLQ